MGQKPIKRHEAIKPYSREHHHGLLLCWKIREGLKHEVAIDRIKKYADFLWETQIEPHFKAEEKYIFPFSSILVGLFSDTKNPTVFA